MSNKVNKEYKRREQIAEAVMAAKEAIVVLDNLGKQYTVWSDEMAKEGDVVGSDAMLLEKAEMLEFKDGFVAIEKEIVRAATITEAFSGMDQIVKAITNCRKSFAKIPNLEQLTNKLLDARKDIDKTRSAIRSLRTVLRNPKDKEISRLFGTKDVMDAKVQQRFEAEKEARDLRLREELINSATPVHSDFKSYKMDTNIDAITAMIDAENKKG